MATPTKYGTLYMIGVCLELFRLAIIETISNVLTNFGLCQCRNRASLPASLSGKTVMITGANCGIGKECAKACVELGASVILACRDLEKAQKAVDDILAEVGPEKEKAENVMLVELDLSSMDSVRACAKVVNEKVKSIDVLLNNAGVMMCPEWKTKDGYEYQFGTNHLGHFLLTNLLIQKLKAAPSARIVNVSSLSHVFGGMYYDNLNLTGIYSPQRGYARSKLANIMFTRELARRLQGTSSVTSYSCHPGLVQSELTRHVPEPFATLSRIVTRFIQISTELGAQTSLYCAFDETIANQSGFYYDNCKRVENLSPHVTDDQEAEKLWNLSLKLCDIMNENYI